MVAVESGFEIIAGTYEEYLLGYKLIEDDNGEWSLEQTIADHSHSASLRTLDVHGKFLASGGADDNIHLYDLKTRRAAGVLSHHEGTITCLRFTPDGSHLVSACEDGSIAFTRSGSWMLDKVFSNAHKKQGVTWLSIHPSGKLAFSIGHDKNLRTWNLVTGKPAFNINLSSKLRMPELVSWSGSGDYFAVCSDNKVLVYRTQEAVLITTIQLTSKVSCLIFNKDDLVVGLWSGDIKALRTSGSTIWELSGEGRVKALLIQQDWLISASSQGVISVYQIQGEDPPRPVTSVETGTRITCLGLYSPKFKQEDEITPKDTTKRKGTTDNPKTSKKKKRTVECYPPNQTWIVEPDT